MAKRNPESKKLERLTNKDMMVVNGPALGDPVAVDAAFPIREAIRNANTADAARLGSSVRSEGRQPDDRNASLCRDSLIYIEYGKLLSKPKKVSAFISEYTSGYKTNRQIAIKEAGKLFGIGYKSAEAAINRAKKLHFKPRTKKHLTKS